MSEATDLVLKELHETWNRALKIEQEALDMAKREEKKDYKVIKVKIDEAEVLFKKRNDAFKRYLNSLKTGK
jgi:hypothetical protein